ncbi:MAG: Wzz/FepE/Etk N-terminal domain-containing protein [Bacilli bacterium]|nr:Wzz/FepE/Etk N-terminal domain-containing protein [Bacilli bacterium]
MDEFNIEDFLKYYISQILIVVIFVIVGLLTCEYYTYGMQVPKYKSSTSIVLTRSTNTDQTITQNDINLNKNLVSTYREIIKSRRILDRVIEKLELKINYKSLASMVSVSSVDETELILVTVSSVEPKEAKNIANEIAKVFKEEIVEIYNIENISIIDKAVLSKQPYNVNVLKQFVMFTGGSFALATLLIFVMFFFDHSIKSVEEVEKKIGLPVIGAIPKYEEKKKGRK